MNNTVDIEQTLSSVSSASTKAIKPLNIAVIGYTDTQNANIIQWIRTAGHHVKIFDELAIFTQYIHQYHLDVILLDQMTPSLSLSKNILNWQQNTLLEQSPVILISSCITEDCKTDAIKAGISAFITKPVNRLELLAKLRKLEESIFSREDIQCFGHYCFNNPACSLTIDGKVISLTAREYRLALYFFNHAECVLERKKILEDVWKINNEIDTRRVDTNISRIRTKLTLNGSMGWILKSVYQKGYILRKQ